MEGAARVIGALVVDADAEGEIQSSSSQLGTATRWRWDIAGLELVVLDRRDAGEVTRVGWCDGGTTDPWER